MSTRLLRVLRFALAVCLAFSTLSYAHETENYRVRMYFGLSMPSGGAVSLYDWDKFQNEQIASAFSGFNVVDSVGYYQGKPERSKVVTIVIKKEDMSVVKEVAKKYATLFSQDSVMVVAVPVDKWLFVKP